MATVITGLLSFMKSKHYDVVFSAVMDMAVVKILIAIAAIWGVDATYRTRMFAPR
jgi:hypothetical protein